MAKVDIPLKQLILAAVASNSINIGQDCSIGPIYKFKYMQEPFPSLDNEAQTYGTHITPADFQKDEPLLPRSS